MKRLRVSVPFFVCLLFGVARAQDIKTAYPGTGVIKTIGNWRFHTGDDPRWNDPALDVTGWETITADAPWGAQTHPGYTGYAWYRRTIEIDGNTGPVSILLPQVDDAYELYWNGQRIGGFGKLPPQAQWHLQPFSNVFALPEPDANGRLRGVLAIRVWKAMLASVDPIDGGGLNGPPQVGDSKVLTGLVALQEARYERGNLLRIVESAILLMIGLLAVGMWLFDRRKRLYLWLGIFLLGYAGGVTASFLDYGRIVPNDWQQFYLGIAGIMMDLGLWMLLLTLFELDRERAWRGATWSLASLYIVSQAVDVAALFIWSSSWPPLRTIDGVTTVIVTVLPAYLFVLLVAGLRRRKDLSLLPMTLACVALETYNLIVIGLGQGAQFTHLNSAKMRVAGTLHLGPYNLSLYSQLGAVVLVTLVWTVYREQARARDEQLAMESELKSAKAVQSVLVPEETPPVPGFAISSLYWPAGEVGGDMFQVIPGNDGDVLVVLADVSGKGLKAAMTVSLMVGAVRAMADWTTSPMQILAGLNTRLMGRTGGGFSTCLVLHVTATGDVTMGNAGHLAPFLNGEALAMEGSLPLGLVAGAEFAESCFHLHEGDDLAMYTDGVLEAQRENGELYGFERAAELMRSRPSVRTVAEAAKQFGQMDDITVVKIARVHADDSRERMSVDVQMIEALA